MRLLEQDLHGTLPGLDLPGPSRVALPVAVNADSLATWLAPAIAAFAASPAFVARYFADGVGAGSLAQAPSLVFNTKDELQARWARRLCHRHVELPRHTLPSTEAFVAAALAGMGWGMHPQALVAPHLDSGALVELVADAPLDVPLYWQTARAASNVLDALSGAVMAAAHDALLAT